MGIGGNSFGNGIEFVSDNYTAKLIFDDDKSYSITTEERIELGRIREIARKIPLIRGVLSIFDMGPIIFLVMLLIIVNDLSSSSPLAFSSTVSLIVIIVTVVVFAYVVKKVLLRARDTWKYHGAEHKTLYAYDKGLELTLKNVKDCPRIARRCGTNLIVFWLLIFAVGNYFIDYFSLVFLGSYILAYEVLEVDNGDRIPVISAFYRLGYLLQQHLFTSEPTDIQLSAAIETLGRLVELEKSVEVAVP